MAFKAKTVARPEVQTLGTAQRLRDSTAPEGQHLGRAGTERQRARGSWLYSGS